MMDFYLVFKNGKFLNRIWKRNRLDSFWEGYTNRQFFSSFNNHRISSFTDYIVAAISLHVTVFLTWVANMDLIIHGY